MSSAKITLIGMYQYLNGVEHEDLFEGFENLPEEVEKDLLVDNVLMRGGDYEVLYPDPDFLKEAITSWSKRYAPTVSNWLRAIDAAEDIAPLENYDRIEQWSDNDSMNHSETEQKTNTSSQTTQNATTNTSRSESQSASTDTMTGSGNTSGTDSTTGTATTTGTDTVSAFDSSTLVNDKGTSQSNSTQTSSTTGTTSQTATNASASTSGNTSISDSENSSGNLSANSTDNVSISSTDAKASTHSGRIHGNIGVTTSAAMWREWMDTVEKYGNIYDAIATIFLQNFVIPLI